MNIKNRSQFIHQQSSEKLTLATVDARARLYTFDLDGVIYSKQMPHFVIGLSDGPQALTQVDSVEDIVEDSWHYDVESGTLSVRLTGDVAPDETELIVTYRFFYSTKSIQLPHTLTNIGQDVHWDGRILQSPGYKHKIGIDQALTSLVGEGTLRLQASDGGLDDSFDRLIFENQRVVIYSWSPQLNPDDAKVIYRGRVTNSSFDGDGITFRIKDDIFNLLDSPNLRPYIDQSVDGGSDFLSARDEGKIQRRVYGRVDGLRCIPVDQLGSGRVITGTVSMEIGTQTITGVGTTFLTTFVSGDNIIVANQEFTIETIETNTSLTVDRSADFGFQGRQARIVSSRGNNTYNRFWRATGHPCAEVNTTVVRALQLNRVRLASVNGLNPGDFITFAGAGNARVQIRRLSVNNTVVLTQNLPLRPANNSVVTRAPIQNVFINGRLVPFDEYDIRNIEGPNPECGLEFFFPEFGLAVPSRSAFNGTFTNGSRTVTTASGDTSLIDIISPGDFVQPDEPGYTNWYKVIQLTEDTLTLSSPLTEATITERFLIRKINYIVDDSLISVDILGKTVDGDKESKWIQTASEVALDLLTESGVDSINLPSFEQGNTDAYQLISMAIPFNVEAKSIPTIKDITDRLNKSVRSSLTLDNDLLIKFQVLNVYAEQNLPTIADRDIIQWKFESTNGKTYRRGNATYRFSDIDRATLEPGGRAFTFDSQFVANYIGTNKVDEFELYLYRDLDAQIATRRSVYYNSRKVSTLSLTTDLRFENIEIGDIVKVDFQRLYARKGSAGDKRKVMMVIGKTVTGERTQLELTDLGNSFNVSGYITANNLDEFSLATLDEKLVNGYITDNQGILENDEDTAGTQLIN